VTRLRARRLLTLAATTTTLLLLWAAPAVADNCGFPADCFTTARAAVATAVGVGVFGAILSIALDVSPLGTAKGIWEAITGRDAITGEELGAFERFLGAVPGAGAILGTGAVAARLAGRLDDAVDVAGSSAQFSRTAARTNADALGNGGGLPFDVGTAQSYADRAGVGLDGVRLQLLQAPDDIRYLDANGAVGFASDDTIYLGPSAFLDEETLVRTLAHERTHIYQQRVWPERNHLEIARFEDAAYAIEDTFWQFFLGSTP